MIPRTPFYVLGAYWHFLLCWICTAFRDFSIASGKIHLKFDHAEGLRLRGDALDGFAIRGKTGDWVWADRGKRDRRVERGGS